MHQVVYQQANALAQKISKDIKSQLHDRDTHILAMLQSMPDLVQSSTDSDDAKVEQESNHYPTQVKVSLALSSDRIQL